jgi:hypothetical protein
MRIRRFFSGLAALVLGAAGLGAVALAGAPPASAATGCSVAYSVSSQWDTGFGVAITITNLGSPLTSCTLGLLLRADRCQLQLLRHRTASTLNGVNCGGSLSRRLVSGR